jgi:hypothetical protein
MCARVRARWGSGKSANLEALKVKSPARRSDSTSERFALRTCRERTLVIRPNARVMALQVRDPRTDQNNGAPDAQTGQQHQGGYVDVAGIDLGNGTAAIALVTVTRTKTTVAQSSSSVQLLAADVSRVAATIVNTDTVKTLYIGLNGAAAVTGTNPVAPGSAYNVPTKAIAGQVNGIWDSGATQGASILATTA